MGNHARLSGTSARQNQQRPVSGIYGLALLLVELREKLDHEFSFEIYI